jgi:RNA polymerase sigma-70 factor (ECF subfamily)
MTGARSSVDDLHDGLSIGALSRRYRAVLLRYFARRNIATSDAQDLAQEVFLRLSVRDALEGVERIEGYLFAVAANIAADFFRHARVRAAEANKEHLEAIHRGEEFTPERLLAGQQELAGIVAALNEMPERMRTIFTLARFENIDRGEIARRLGISKRLVEQQITLATACLIDRRERME